MYKRYIALENSVRKGEIACNMQFLLFSQCFLPYMALIFYFECTLKCHIQFLSIWMVRTSLKFCYLVTVKRNLGKASWRYNGHHDITEILLKMGVDAIQIRNSICIQKSSLFTLTPCHTISILYINNPGEKPFWKYYRKRSCY